jgi:hypothetical protein
MIKQNCWEFKKCGREPGGHNAETKGICPATIEKRTNGIHGGKNAGRCCWAVLATNCKGAPNAEILYAEKLKTCMNCDFYKVTFKEEFGKPSFRSAGDISQLLLMSASNT